MTSRDIEAIAKGFAPIMRNYFDRERDSILKALGTAMARNDEERLPPILARLDRLEAAAGVKGAKLRLRIKAGSAPL